MASFPEVEQAIRSLGGTLEDDGTAYIADAPDEHVWTCTGTASLVAEYDSNGHAPVDRGAALQSIMLDIKSGIEHGHTMEDEEG